MCSTTDDYIKQFRANNYELNERICRAFDARPATYKGLRWMDAGPQKTEHNGVELQDIDEAKLEDQATHLVAHFELVDRAFHWIVGPQAQPSLESMLNRHGFGKWFEEEAMAVRLEGFDMNEALPEHVQIARVLDGSTADEWAATWSFWDLAAPSHVVEHWSRISRRLVDPRSNSGVFLYIATTDKKHEKDCRLVSPGDGGVVTVGTGALHRFGNTALIWNVTTLPAYRRRGIGCALLKGGMRLAKALGCTTAMVAASPGIKSSCERLGFKQFGTVKTYVWYPLSEAEKDGWEIV